jgi:ketol-acid reductoisomerase
MEKHGIAGMRAKISDTALYGAMTRGPEIINGNVRRKLSEIFREIKSGKFAKELASESKKGNQKLKELLVKDRAHRIEKIRRKFGQ